MTDASLFAAGAILLQLTPMETSTPVSISLAPFFLWNGTTTSTYD